MADAAGWWQRLSKRQQLTALLLGGGVLIFSVDAVALSPLRRRVSQLHQDVRETERQFLDAVVASYKTRAVSQALPLYGPFMQPAGSAEVELASALGEVEAAVRTSGVALLNLKPVAQRDGATEAMNITVEVEASPTQLIRLLDAIQRSAKLLKVAELNLRVSEAKTLRASMVINKLLLK